VDVVSLVSEFPNDNPALHRGVRWICLEVTGGCTPEMEAYAEPSEEIQLEPERVEGERERVEEEGEREGEREVEQPGVLESGVVLAGGVEEEEEEIIVEELEPLGDVEPDMPLVMVATETLPPPSDATEPATVLPPPPEDPFTVLVCRLADIAIGVGSQDVAGMLPALLMDGRLSAEVTGETAEALKDAGIVVDGAVTATFAAQTAAWRAILRGTSDDFDATGGAMLDEWAADLLACLLGARSRGASLRKDLRARGVAAFGLLEAA
jgi:hypothetical protein